MNGKKTKLLRRISKMSGLSISLLKDLYTPQKYAGFRVKGGEVTRTDK